MQQCAQPTPLSTRPLVGVVDMQVAVSHDLLTADLVSMSAAAGRQAREEGEKRGVEGWTPGVEGWWWGWGGGGVEGWTPDQQASPLGTSEADQHAA